jgi:hypothetical protein
VKEENTRNVKEKEKVERVLKEER